MRRFSYHEVNKLKKLCERTLDIKFLIYRAKWRLADRFKYLSNFPLHLDIESTNACDLKCIMCIKSRVEDSKIGFIDMKLVRKIIDEGAKNNLYSIKFNWRGEPLLHKGLTEFIRYAKEKGIIDVQFNTNGLSMDEARVRDFIKAGLDRIIFSIDGATKETYEKIRRGANFERVVENIKMLARLKKELNSRTPFLKVQMVQMKDNIAEVDSFIKMWQSIANQITITDCDGRNKDVYQPDLNNIRPIGRICCPEPWHRMTITWDGKAVICCADWYLKNIIGNAYTQTIKEIWLGKEFKRLRKLHRENRLNQIDACKDCFIIESYIWDGRKS